MENARQSQLEVAQRKAKESKKEVDELRISSDNIRKQADDLSNMFTSTLTSTGMKKATTRASAPSFSEPRSFRKPATSPKRNAAKPAPNVPAPDIPVPTTKAQRLREARREAERASMTKGEDEDEEPALAGLYLKKKEWTTMGPRPKDPSLVQRVDRQRDLGEVRMDEERRTDGVER